MTEASNDPKYVADVIIVGGGPSGLSAAYELKRLGVENVVVLEREPQAGGIPRHCGHPPFGMREFYRVLTGPAYARRLVKTALRAGVDIRTSTTVVEMRPHGKLLITGPDGMGELSARRVIYATGVRETPRSARLVGGQRPLGILNTGALQSMVYLENLKPFQRPVIVGTELVSFSAILTCRHMNIKPGAMLETSNRVTARWPVRLLASALRVPVYFNASVDAICGDKRVTDVKFHQAAGKEHALSCDGVLMTGRFRPEATLARCGHLVMDEQTGGPLVDNYWRCSDPSYFAAGNVLRPVETAGWCWREGKRVAGFVAADLAGKLPAPAKAVPVTVSDPAIAYCMPQKFVAGGSPGGVPHLQLRVAKPARGVLEVKSAGTTLWRKRLSSRPERRILIPAAALENTKTNSDISITFSQL